MSSQLPTPYVITGIPKDAQNSNDTAPIRQDVDKWYLEQTRPESNRIQLTLFVEALTEIQKRDATDMLSYFRLAGIHAAPWTTWDGEEPGEDEKGNAKNFCVHNDYTFPTWHRVYLLLYEQVIHNAMLDFINKQSNVLGGAKSQWRQEADQWRLPYWDFASFATHGKEQSDELRLPILATIPTVKVRVFGLVDRLENKPNPMYKFETDRLMGNLDQPFTITGQLEKKVMIPFDKCLATTKYGLLDGYNADVWADAGQNWTRSNLALNEHPWYQSLIDWESVPTLQDMTFRLLTTEPDNWGRFSTTQYYPIESDQPKNWMSLEAIHNNVHNWVGGFYFQRPGQHDVKLWGAGHMSCVPVAAFDPIFWLHHCNIDRLTAIWQSLNPDKWFDDEKSKKSRNDYLYPFHKNLQRDLFQSDDLRDWREFNYDYEITKQRDGKPRDKSSIVKDVTDLYGKKTKELYKKYPNADHNDYVINVRYDRYALGGRPFQINVFFGDVDRKDFYDPRSQNFVGSVFNFSTALDGSNCGNCIKQQEEGILSVSQIPATLAVYYYRKTYEKNPIPSFVVVNSLGQSVDVKVDIKLDQIEGRFFGQPGYSGGRREHTTIGEGVPAKVDY